jgi:hypothetical protein
MILLADNCLTVEGVTVYPDHANQNMFWWLAAPVALADRSDGADGTMKAFTFLKFKPAAVSAGVKGGGFAMFTLALKLPPGLEGKIRSQIANAFPTATDPVLAPVAYDSGTVECIALNLQGSGGTQETPQPPGTFVAVEQILGSRTPSLFGDNTAAFSLTLTQEGATLLEQAFVEGTAPIGAVYNLKFTALRPALDAKLTADMKRMYDSFSVGLTANVYWVSASFDAAFQKLKEDGVIKIEITNQTLDDAATQKAEDQALQLFKEQIAGEWFRPSLSPPVPGTPGTSNPGGAHPTPTSPGTAHPAPTSPFPTSPISGNPPVNPTPPMPTNPAPPGVGGGGGLPAPVRDATAPAPTRPAPTAHPAPTRPQGGNPNPQGGGNNNNNRTVPPGTNGVSSPFGVSLRLQYVQQEELKTLTVEYHRQDAVQRTYGPQGFFGLALAGLDKSKYFKEIDLDDPFFRTFQVTVTPPTDFTGIGLRSAHVALDYGNPADPQNSRHQEYIFDAANMQPQLWKVFRNAAYDTRYTFTVDYHFDAEAGWAGERLSYQLPAQTTENEALYLNPFELLGFLTVNVTGGRISWAVVDHVEVNLSYQSASGWKTNQQMIIKAENSAQVQSWKLRLADKDDRAYTYQLVHHLLSGDVITEDPVRSSAAAVLVTDPFRYSIDVQVVPTLDPSKTKQAFVDVDYDDPDHNWTFSDNIAINGGSGSVVHMRIPIYDNAKRDFRWRVTVVGVNGSRSTGPYVTTHDPRLFVTDSGGGQ